MVKIKELPSGSWNALVYNGKDSMGKRTYKSFTAGSKKEVEYMVTSYEQSSKADKTVILTLKQAYERYIESKNNILSPSTVREYRRAAAKDLQGLMAVKIDKITQEKVQREINEFALNHSPKSVRNAHGLLSAVLAVYRPNLILKTTLPQKIKPDIYVPSDEDIQKLLTATDGKGLHKAILLAAVGTLRRSEICALNAADIHPNGVNVAKAMVLNDKKEWIIKEKTKTTAGKRFVELPEAVVEKIKVEGGRVYPWTPGSITDSFSELTLKVLGKKFRFHDLRHYSASVLHALGVPDVYIMQRGGWESRDTLNKIYTHILTKEQEKINKKIILHFEENILKEKEMQDEMQDRVKIM